MNSGFAIAPNALPSSTWSSGAASGHWPPMVANRLPMYSLDSVPSETPASSSACRRAFSVSPSANGLKALFAPKFLQQTISPIASTYWHGTSFLEPYPATSKIRIVRLPRVWSFVQSSGQNSMSASLKTWKDAALILYPCPTNFSPSQLAVTLLIQLAISSSSGITCRSVLRRCGPISAARSRRRSTSTPSARWAGRG